jgi:hypothetical protein
MEDLIALEFERADGARRRAALARERAVGAGGIVRELLLRAAELHDAAGEAHRGAAELLTVELMKKNRAIQA